MAMQPRGPSEGATATDVKRLTGAGANSKGLFLHPRLPIALEGGRMVFPSPDSPLRFTFRFCPTAQSANADPVVVIGSVFIDDIPRQRTIDLRLQIGDLLFNLLTLENGCERCTHAGEPSQPRGRQAGEEVQ